MYVVRRGTLRWTAQGVRSADRRRHGREARGAAHIPRAARMIHDSSIIFFYSSRCSQFISYIFSIESPLLLLLPPPMGTSVVIRSSYLTQRSTDSRMGPLGSRSSARERLYPRHPIARRPHHFFPRQCTGCGEPRLGTDSEYAAWYQVACSSKLISVIWRREHICFQ